MVVCCFSSFTRLAGLPSEAWSMTKNAVGHLLQREIGSNMNILEEILAVAVETLIVLSVF